MSLYTRARKHIDMNRVKELREEKIKREKIAEIVEQQQQTLAELERIEAEESKHVDWRRELEEGMTSFGMLVTSTLDATGDTIQTDIPRDSASDLRYNISDAVTVSDGAIRFGEVAPNNYSGNWWTQSAGTNFIRTTDEIGTKKVTHITFNVDVGTGIDAPLPQHPLTIGYQMRTSGGFNAGTGTLGTISSSGLHSFELPQYHEFYQISFDLDVEGTYLQQYEAAYQRRQFVGTTIYGMTVTEDDTINSLAPGRMLRLILDHPGPYDDDANTSMTVLLAHTRTNGQTVYQSMNTMPSGETGGHTLSDRQYLYNLIRSQYAHLKDRYAKTYTINSLGLTRRTPITVFTALDSPEASSFVRDGDFDRLSPAEKKRRLEEQLRSSEEYLNKMFGEGMPKGATELLDVQPQQSFADIAQGPRGFDRPPGSYSPSNIIPIRSPGSRWRPGEGFDLKDPLKNIPFQGPGYSKKGGDTMVAANQGPSTPVKYDSDMKQLVPNPGGGRPGKIRLKGKAKMFAHHEPQGEVIKEKKIFKDLTKKIPGYYDGKPSPLGFPVEEPPKMKNGYHPDLVDGKKVANRFNRLDPISAKAMPPTGNPHIDKKVRAAARKPK